MDSPVGKGELLLENAPTEVRSQVHTRLKGRVAHNGRTTPLSTQGDSEADPLRHNNCQLVSKPEKS